MPGYGQSLGAALGQLAFGGGDPERSKSGMKGMLDGAHAGAYEASAKQSLAQALKAQADAANTNAQTGILTNRGANVDMSMAAESGVPMPQINAFRDYLKTGVKPMSSATGDMQTDEAIGIAPAPTFDNGVMAKLAPLMKRNLPYLTNVGDIKIDDAAQADATYNTTGLINRVAGGGKQGDAVRALLAAKGKAEFDNLGGNGVFSGVDGGSNSTQSAPVRPVRMSPVLGQPMPAQPTAMHRQDNTKPARTRYGRKSPKVENPGRRRSSPMQRAMSRWLTR